MSLGSSVLATLKWLLHYAASFVLWAFWLLLTGTLVILIGIACSHELQVPNQAIQIFKDRLAVAGLKISFDTARFDPSGNVLIENLQVFGDSFEEPLATCPAVFLRLDPWALVVGSVEIQSLHGHQLNLFVPAMLSPTGKSEPVISDLDFAIEPNNTGYSVERLIGHSGKLSLSVFGRFDRIRTSNTKKKSAATLTSHVLAEYFRAASQIALWKNKADLFDEPILRVFLTPDARRGAIAHVTFTARSAELNARDFRAAGPDWPVRLQNLRLATSAPVIFPPTLNWTVAASIKSIADNHDWSAEDLRFQLKGDSQLNAGKFRLQLADVSASKVKVKTVSVFFPNLATQLAHWPEVQAQVSAKLADETWGFKLVGNPVEKIASAHADGRISSKLIAWVDETFHRNFSSLLTLSEPAPASLDVHLAQGWKLSRAAARFDASHIVAREVAMIRAAAALEYDGQSLIANDVILVQPGNEATGSYWMDTKTLDYRFLLQGALRPAGIDGWFHDWWPHFWSRFDFSSSPPVADVDVQGRWRAPHLSKIFVHVTAQDLKVRTVPFDLVRISLFIRPDFYDAPELYAKLGPNEARGRFTRSVDLDEDEVKWMDFQVKTNLPIQETAKIFGEEGTDLVEPFVFDRPAQLQISGRLEGEAGPTGPHQSVDVSVDSTGGFHFFDFPLTDLRCDTTVRDSVITVSNLRVGFADGVATGHAQVTGKEPHRHITLDTELRGANLGQAIQTLEEYGAKQKGESASGPSVFQARLAKGKLDLQGTAEGAYHNLLSFTGTGHAELRAGDLGQINLLGSLSTALQGNSLLGFTSWNLDTGQADFTLNHDKLQLSAFRITGPTAKIEGHGTYSLAEKAINVHVKFYPFEEGKTLLANAVGFVLTPVSAALQLKLSGSLSKPKWFFEYGPTNFFRKISRPDVSEPTPENPTLGTPVAEPKPLEPPPFLRR